MLIFEIESGWRERNMAEKPDPSSFAACSPESSSSTVVVKSSETERVAVWVNPVPLDGGILSSGDKATSKFSFSVSIYLVWLLHSKDDSLRLLEFEKNSNICKKQRKALLPLVEVRDHKQQLTINCWLSLYFPPFLVILFGITLQRISSIYPTRHLGCKSHFPKACSAPIIIYIIIIQIGYFLWKLFLISLSLIKPCIISSVRYFETFDTVSDVEISERLKLLNLLSKCTSPDDIGKYSLPPSLPLL